MSEQPLRFPISIDSVLHVSFNVQHFKLLFNFVLETLQQHQISLFNITSQTSKHQTSFEQLRSLLAQLQTPDEQQIQAQQNLLQTSIMHSSQIEDLKNRLFDLTNSLQDQKAALNRQQETVAVQVNTLQQTQKVVADNSTQIEFIEKKFTDTFTSMNSIKQEADEASPQINSEAMQKVYQQFSNLTFSFNQKHEQIQNEINTVKELVYQGKTEKESVLLKRVDTLEVQVTQKKQIVRQHTREISQVDGILGDLKWMMDNKVDKASLQTALDEMNNLNQKQIVDPSQIAELKELIEANQKEIQALNSKVKPQLLRTAVQRIDQIQDRLLSKADKSLFDKLKINFEDLEKLVHKHSKKIAKLKTRSVQTTTNLQTAQSSISTLQSGFSILKTQLSAIRASATAKLKKISANLKLQKESLQEKLSRSSIEQIQKSLLSKVAQDCQAMLKKAADKAQTQKYLRSLQRMLHQCLNTLRQNELDQDAMFSKKPLGGTSCASCAKKLKKMKGKISPYHPWNKLPFKDPINRDAHSGAGFSRIISSVQPDQLSSRGKFRHSPNVSVYQTEEFRKTDYVSLPPVNRNDRPSSGDT